MRKHSSHLSKAVLFTLLSAACVGAAAEHASARPQDIEDLKRAIQDILTHEKVPGASVALITRDGVTWAGGVGKADVAAGTDVTADTLFRAGSISKIFVALALVKLSEEGKIDLNARVSDVAPDVEIENPWESTAPVRVVNLLEHTAGFDDMHFNEMFNDSGRPDPPLKDVLALNSRSRRVLWQPGIRASYSNPGYAVAGYVIEKITGKAYDDYVREEFLNPLGMSRTGFRLDRGTLTQLARGYKDSTFQPVPPREMYLRPAGSLNSSARELGLIVSMLLLRGRVGDAQILRPESIARMEEPRSSLAARAGLRVGPGLGIEHQLDGPITFLGHSGGLEGFCGSLGYSPASGVGYVFLLNSSSSPKGWREIRDVVSSYALHGRAVPPRPTTKLTADQLQLFAGYYEPVVSRDQFMAFMNLLLGGTRVFVQSGALYEKRVFGAAEALTPVTASSFRLQNESDASMIFLQEQDGSVVLAGDESYLRRRSPLIPRCRLLAILTCLVLMLSSLLFAPVWLLRKAFGGLRGVQHLSVRAVPLGAVLSLVAMLFVLRGTPLTALGTLNVRTVAVWVLSWLFALLSIWSIVLAYRSLSYQMNRVARIHSVLVSMANFAMAVFFAYWQVIGLRTWAW